MRENEEEVVVGEKERANTRFRAWAFRIFSLCQMRMRTRAYSFAHFFPSSFEFSTCK